MKHTLVGLLLAAVVAAPASAQTQAQTQPPAEAPMIKTEGLPTVFLTDRQGAEHRGRLIRVEPAEVVLLGPSGERTFKREEIAVIETQGDSLKNGALIGAAVGALGGLFASGFADCPDAEDSCAGSRVAFFAVSTGIYTAIGVGIDALIQGRKVLYRAHPNVALAVHARPTRLAIGLNFKW